MKVTPSMWKFVNNPHFGISGRFFWQFGITGIIYRSFVKMEFIKYFFQNFKDICWAEEG